MNDRNDKSEQESPSNGNREPVYALVDGELDTTGAQFLLRRLAEDEGMQEHWQRCHLVRACLQHEFEQPVSLVSRVRAALESEVSPESRNRMSSLRRVGLGGAIAASVALVAVAGLEYRLGVEGSGSPSLRGDSPGFVSQSTALDRQFSAEAVPTGFGLAADEQAPARGRPNDSRQRINRYMIRHSQASGSTGFNSLTSVLAAPEAVRLAPAAADGADSIPADDNR